MTSLVVLSILLPFCLCGSHVALLSCRSLKTLFLEESTIVENDGEWIHELALNNTVLENLNFYQTYLGRVNAEDLELIAKNCPSLVSVKISECDISNLIGFFKAAVALEEFGGGSFSEPTEPAAENGYNEQFGRYSAVSFPQRLCHLGPTYLGINEMHILFPIASHLKKLDLLYAFLDTEAHCFLLQKCPNLEILEVESQLFSLFFSSMQIGHISLYIAVIDTGTIVLLLL